MSHDWPDLLFFGTFFGGVALGIVMIGCAAFADGKIDYCMIKSRDVESSVMVKTRVFDLIGHRPWRADTTIAGSLYTFDEALGYASAMGCEVK